MGRASFALLLGVLLLGTALPLGTPAWAFDEPVAFHGIPWGMPMAQVETRLAAEGIECAAWQCFVRSRLGSVPVTLSFEFHGGKFTVGHVVFDVRRYAAIRDTFVARYGAPTVEDATEPAERSGSRFAIDMLRWDGKDIVIALVRYGAPIDRGIALLMPRVEYQRRYPLGLGIAGTDDRR